MNKGEHALREPHLSTNRAIIEQSIVEPVTDFSLSHINMLVVPCDKEELCDNSPFISSPQLEHGRANSVLNDLHAVFYTCSLHC
jgi:hypothetical protein